MKKMLILLLAVLCMGTVAMAEDGAEPIAPVLMLEGNRTTGFDWYWAVDSEDVVGIACEYVTSWQPENDEDIMPPGTGGYSRITLAGITPGEATITFTYRRPWEEKEPLYTLVYCVRVDEDLNVTILSSRFDW